MNFTEFDVRWCQGVFEMMAVGGVWGVPRSGLIFRKTKLDPPTLELYQRLPFDPAMPMDEDELLEFQEHDLATIREAFAEAGITVEGKVK